MKNTIRNTALAGLAALVIGTAMPCKAIAQEGNNNALVKYEDKLAGLQTITLPQDCQKYGVINKNVTLVGNTRIDAKAHKGFELYCKDNEGNAKIYTTPDPTPQYRRTADGHALWACKKQGIIAVNLLTAAMNTFIDDCEYVRDWQYQDFEKVATIYTTTK